MLLRGYEQLALRALDLGLHYIDEDDAKKDRATRWWGVEGHRGLKRRRFLEWG